MGEKRQMQVSRSEVQMACAMCGLGRGVRAVYSTDLLCRAGMGSWENAAARMTGNLEGGGRWNKLAAKLRSTKQSDWGGRG